VDRAAEVGRRFGSDAPGFPMKLCPVRGLVAAPFRLVQLIGRSAGLLDVEHPELVTSAIRGDETFGELLDAQGRTNDILEQLLVENRLTRDSKGAEAVGNLVRHELDRLASAQEQTNEVLAALIEGLAQLAKLQVAARPAEEGSRLSEILAAQERTNELLERALHARQADGESSPRP
jgi:hypothetical protein